MTITCRLRFDCGQRSKSREFAHRPRRTVRKKRAQGLVRLPGIAICSNAEAVASQALDFRYNRLINQPAFYTLYPVAPDEIGLMNNLASQSTVDYRTTFRTLAEHIEGAYSLKVNVGPVTGSYTGQFDGKEIWVDLDRDPEEAVFILVHLFGHTVQWNLDEKLRLLGLGNSGVKAEDLPRIYQYERQASQLGLALLQETGEFRLARWLSDRFGADWKFLAHFYRTGEKLQFSREAGADEPLLSALPIPSFVPQRWPPRGSF